MNTIMNSEFIITTTNNIEGCPIERYINTICSNIVIGTNVFSDLAASFSDFFGGRSESYKKKLGLLYDEVTKELKQNALQIGANAIIGFKVDFDEISGKDKSMFMVSASGTACFVDLKKQNFDIKQKKQDVISQIDLDKELYRKNLISKINQGNSLSPRYIEFLMENPQFDILETLLNNYMEYFKASNEHKDTIDAIERLISAYPRTDIMSAIYQKYSTTNDCAIAELIKNCDLFDAKSILDLCNSKISCAISLLSAKSDYYSSKELEIMKQISNKLSNLPDTGRIEAVKGGLLGKVQDKFICSNGHKNAVDSEYCETCEINKKGLQETEVSAINTFKQKVETLEWLLMN